MNERHANIFQNHFVAIQNRWRYELSSCRNFRFTCLVIDRRHYALNSNDLRAWNAAINKGEATIHSPPVHLHPKPSHVSKKRKARTGYSSDPEEYSPKRQNRDRWQPGIHYHIHQGHSKHSNIILSSSPPPSPPTRAEKRPSSSSSSLSSIDLNEIREPNEAMDVVMKKYFDWHVARTPEDTADLFAAYQALNIEQFQLQQLSSITTATWKEMGIPLGIGFRLSSDVKMFKRAALACKSTFIYFNVLK